MPSGVKAMFQKLHPAFPLDNKQWGRGNKQTNIDHKIMHMKQLKARILSKVIIFWWKKNHERRIYYSYQYLKYIDNSLKRDG